MRFCFSRIETGLPLTLPRANASLVSRADQKNMRRPRCEADWGERVPRTPQSREDSLPVKKLGLASV